MLNHPRSLPATDAAQPDVHAMLAQLDQKVTLLARTVEETATLQPVQRVRVTDVDMSFGSMVGFMVKWAIAAIPALIILAALGFLGFMFLTIFFAALL